MKKGILILLLVVSLLVLVGCVETKYQARYYTDTGKLDKEIEVTHKKAFVSDTKKDLTAKLADGSKFGVASIETIADPNSAKAIGEAISLGTSNILKKGGGG